MSFGSVSSNAANLPLVFPPITALRGLSTALFYVSSPIKTVLTVVKNQPHVLATLSVNPPSYKPFVRNKMRMVENCLNPYFHGEDKNKNALEPSYKVSNNTAKAGAAKAISLSVAHAVEIGALAAGIHPVWRAGALTLPYVFEPLLTDKMQKKLHYQHPDPSNQHPAPAWLASLASLTLWSGAQPLVKIFVRHMPKPLQIGAALGATALVGASKDIYAVLYTEKEKQLKGIDNTLPSSPPSDAMHLVQANVVMAGVRSMPEVIRQVAQHTTKNPVAAFLLGVPAAGAMPAATAIFQPSVAVKIAAQHPSD